MESVGTLGCKCEGTLTRQRKEIGGRNPVLESSSHSGGARQSLVYDNFGSGKTRSSALHRADFNSENALR